MSLFLGRNAQQCCDSYGLSLHSIRAVYNQLAWSLFYRNLELPELDKIQIIKELLCDKYGLISLPLFDLFLVTFYLYFLYDFILNIFWRELTSFIYVNREIWIR